MNQIDIQKLSEIRAETINEIEEAWKKYDRIACVRYPGFGKSYHVVKTLIEKNLNKQFLILVHRKALKKIYEENLFGYNHVKIETYQKLCYGIYDFNDYLNFDFIICDECHHLIDTKWLQKVNSIYKFSSNKCKILGITANEETFRKGNIIQSFDIVTSNLDIQFAIENSFLHKPKYVVAVCEPDDAYIKSLKNISKEKLKQYYEVDRYKIENLINVHKILKKHLPNTILNQNYKILCFVSRIKKIEEASKSLRIWFEEAFPTKKINIYKMESYLHEKDNSSQFDRFRNNLNPNDIDIMISVDMLNEGIHIPGLSTVIMLRVTQSPVIYLQQFGRALDNNYPVIFDFVSNYSRLNYFRNQLMTKNKKIIGSQFEDNPLLEKCEVIDETKSIKEILQFYRRSFIDITEEQHLFLIKNSKNMTLYEIIDYMDPCHKFSKSTWASFLNKNNLTYKHIKVVSPKLNITAKQKDYLLLNISNMTEKDVCIYLNAGRESVKRILRELNIENKLVKLRKYTNDEINYLQENSKNMTIKDIMLYLHCDINQARGVAQTYNLEYKKSYRAYTKEQIEYVRNNGYNMTYEDIASYLGTNSKNAVYKFVSRYHIKYNKKSYKYPPEKIKYLKDNCPLLLIDIMDYMGITNKNTARSFCTKYKIKIKREQKGVK